MNIYFSVSRKSILEHARTRGSFEYIAHHLSFGTLKRVELARALASRPKFLLLDEPASGLNHEEVALLGKLIRAIRDHRHITILLVEHHMSLVMQVSDHVVVLDFGKRIGPLRRGVRPR